MNKPKKMDEVILELEKYARLASDEYGEYLRGLIYLYPFSNFLPDIMDTVLIAEIQNQLDHCKNNFNIIEKRSTEVYLELEDK